MRSTTTKLLFVATGFCLVVGVHTYAGQTGAAFNYQGQLKEGGVPASGYYDFMFRLYGQAERGDEIPGTEGGILVEGMLVTSGLFAVDLDFGSDVFQGHEELWLEIAVKPAEFAPADFTTLAPRQRLSATPRAIVADYARSTAGGTLRFGEMTDTTIGVNPNVSGLTAMDPFGLRVMSTTQARQCSGSGESCWFDQHCPEGETCEPCDSCPPVPNGTGAVYFGPGDETSISKEPGSTGLAVNSEGGLTLLGGTRICSEEYPPYGEVLYCEADSDCYGCCTQRYRCCQFPAACGAGIGELCDSDEDCSVGACNDSGLACHDLMDCAPGGCYTGSGSCYVGHQCHEDPKVCNDPPPEGCSGGEACLQEKACLTRCYSDEDCPEEGSLCDHPPPGECIVPEGRCSGNQAPCHEDTDCSPGHCAEYPDYECWDDGHCLSWHDGIPTHDNGPCVGAQECVHPEPIGPAAVNFGETGMYSIGFNPGLGGLTGAGPDGLHLVSTGNTCSGTGEPCESDEDCLEGGCSDDGYPCRDDEICGYGNTCTSPPPETCESFYGMGSVKVFFGLGNDSSIGTDSASTGLVVKDPVGLRLMSPGADMMAPTKLLLGPTDDFFIGYDMTLTGTHINDPNGIHLTSFMGGAAQRSREEPMDVRLYFGPTSDTYIGTLPDATGLTLSDPGGVRILNSMDPAENALIFGMNGADRADGTRIDTGIASSGMRFLAPNFFFDGGPVGIGDGSPDAPLDVEKDFPIGTPGAVAVFNRTGSDGVILDFQMDGASVGNISTSRGTVSYNSFTGSHLAWTDMAIERGSLVRLTGLNRRLHGIPESEIVYGIAPSTTANDPSCLGAYLTEHDIRGKVGAGRTHLVMAEGNGEMWVVDTGSDIRPGDYLIASDVSGCAMKDDPLHFPTGHVVARAAEGVCWESVEPDAGAVKKAKVSVFFQSFVRSGDATRLTGEVARLGSIVESQRRTIETLEERFGSLKDLAERLSRLEKTEGTATGEAGSCTGGTK